MTINQLNDVTILVDGAGVMGLSIAQVASASDAASFLLVLKYD